VKGNAPADDAAAAVVVDDDYDYDMYISRPNDKINGIRMLRRFKLRHVNTHGWTNARNWLRLLGQMLATDYVGWTNFETDGWTNITFSRIPKCI
jgi:hypothetical protein